VTLKSGLEVVGVLDDRVAHKYTSIINKCNNANK